MTKVRTPDPLFESAHWVASRDLLCDTVRSRSGAPLRQSEHDALRLRLDDLRAALARAPAESQPECQGRRARSDAAMPAF